MSLRARGDKQTTLMSWCRGMRRARQIKRRVPQQPGVGIRTREIFRLGTANDRSYIWHPTSLIKSSPAWFDTTRTWQKTYRPTLSSSNFSHSSNTLIIPGSVSMDRSASIFRGSYQRKSDLEFVAGHFTYRGRLYHSGISLNGEHNSLLFESRS